MGEGATSKALRDRTLVVGRNAYGIKVKFSFEHFHDGLSEGKYVC